ncbi:MAG: hypothetical protein WBQ50_00130 [Nocardioides sp.]
MYQNGPGAAGGAAAGAGVVAGTLGMTGLVANAAWLFLAGFALIALGLAVMRIVPRREE